MKELISKMMTLVYISVLALRYYYSFEIEVQLKYPIQNCRECYLEDRKENSVDVDLNAQS